jgi:uncharacterized protein (TIGR02466 family)
MEQIELFPTIVSRSQFADHARHREGFVAAIEAAVATGQSALRSADGGKRQTVDELLAMPAFDPLVVFIVAEIRKRFEAFKIVGADFFIASSWATVSQPGELLALHDHPNSYLSGSYYVQCGENSGVITFRDPRPINRMFDLRTSEKNRVNAGMISVVPRVGMLLLFPSWLEHLVEPNRSNERRISLSFNVMLKGELGRAEGLTRLTL